MTFLSTLALAAAVLVIAPYLAHRLRRRRAEDVPFAPAHLVQPAAPKARRKSKLEDRALFGVRAASVLLLAALGATPFVRCSRLSLQRSGGASVAIAIVVDDSMSMRAQVGGSRSRFERAKQGARDLLASAREGDAIAVLLAGAPARVALAATTDLSAVRQVVDGLAASDRATDLDGALAMARSLLSALPQVDRRIVVLSDLADGRPDGPPIGESSPIPVWVPLPEIRGALPDCAVMRADRSEARVRVHVTCSPGATAAGRELVVVDAKGATLAKTSVPTGSDVDATALLPSSDVAAFRAHLTGTDAIAADDVAPVVPEAGRGAIAVVADATDEAVATGGAPIVEQALAALKVDIDVRPLPLFPDRLEDLVGDLGVVLDDPPGLTPEQRHALAGFLDGGGVVMLAVGPHAVTAPLGASLEPLLAHAASWSDNHSTGADPASATGELAEAAQTLSDLGAPHRAVLAPEDAATFESVLRWTDGAPLVARRSVSRGEAWIVTLPFSVETSDLALRPAYLALLDEFVRSARERAAPRRTEVGVPWKFLTPSSVKVEGPSGPVETLLEENATLVVPSVLGSYEVTAYGKTETRVAAPAAREVDLRPRAAAPSTAGGGLGATRALVDVSGEIALALLAVVAAEMALRVWSRRKMEPV